MANTMANRTIIIGGWQLVARDFRVREVHKKNATCYALQAKSQQESLQAMQLCFAQEALTEIYLTDQLGQQTHIRFTHIKTNIALQQSLFKLTIPKGTDVVEQ